MKVTSPIRHLVAVSAAAFAVSAANAELVIVANDNKVTLVNGSQVVATNPAPDVLAVVDLAGERPRIVAEIEGVPNSVIGPPAGSAITPNEELALVASSNRIDPANPTRQTPDNRLTVVDLTAKPPRIIATLETGRAPSGVGINRAGTLALVGNHEDGTVSVFTIAGKTVTPVGRVKVAEPAAGVRHPIFTPDGRSVVLTCDGEHEVIMLRVDGQNVSVAGRTIRPGFKPYAGDVSRDGSIAVVGNVGFLSGDVDTLGVIDLRAQPPRLVDSINVGQTPECVGLSPDGSLCAVVLLNGSTKAKGTPFYQPQGRLRLYRVEGTKLTFAAEAPIGAWPQGMAISSDNRTVLATSMVDKAVHVFRWDGKTLSEKEPLKMKGGPSTIGWARK
jgi:DNA-binding beta-propeller fold protein YncE